MRGLVGRLFSGKEDDEEKGGVAQTLSNEEKRIIEESASESEKITPPKESEPEEKSSAIREITEDSSLEEEPSSPPEVTIEKAIGLDLTQPMKVMLDQTSITPKQTQSVEEQNGPPRIEVVQRCHIGNVRGRNEDSSYIFTAETGGQEPLLPFGIYIVADGMGGHHDGHEASRNVSRQVAQDVLERIYIPSLVNSITGKKKSQEPIGEVMIEAVQAANRNIYSDEPEKDSGTTLTAALLFGRRLYIAHVGDSRAYLYANGTFNQLTTDHSYVRRLIDTGQITKEEAAVHPQRNMLYRAVGQGGDLEIETFTKSLPQSGKLILCSDGLWGLIPDSIIKRIIEEDSSLLEKADQLIDLARQSGGHDNISVVIASFNF